MKSGSGKILENPELACLTVEGLRLVFDVLTHPDFDVLTHGKEWSKGSEGFLDTWTVYLKESWMSGARRTLLQSCIAAKEELDRRAKK